MVGWKSGIAALGALILTTMLAATPALAAPLPAGREGVSVTSQGDKVLYARTSGPSNKAYYTFTIKDPRGVARTYESCLYNAFEDDWYECKTHPLKKGRWVKPTPQGWIITGYLWYRKPVSPATCQWANYNWPKFKSDIEVFDKYGDGLARDWHGVAVKCTG